MKTWIVTGGAGFIGSCFVRRAIVRCDVRIVNLDKLTYASNLDALPTPDGEKYVFVEGDISDTDQVLALCQEYKPQAILHFAAESHVDRSIDGPMAFVETNVVGTARLLEAALQYWLQLDGLERAAFRFLHVSTDEVYGSLGATGEFSETDRYAPSSPYSASKAASDHFVRAWHRTYGIPVIITSSSNNYGPYQHPEKLIPLMILNALNRKSLPIYGDGQNVRDWIHVDDHCEALELILAGGRVGETYNIGAHNERTNLEIVHHICDMVNRLLPALNYSCRDLITFVRDRPGHDLRYAMNTRKVFSELGWKPRRPFNDGLDSTVRWYVENNVWASRAQAGELSRSHFENP